MSFSSRRFLQYNEVLELFPKPTAKLIYEKAEFKSYQPHDIIFAAGDEGSFMAGVMSGRLRMYVSSREGKEMIVTMVEKGELFGEMSVLDNERRAVSVAAETTCSLMLIKKDDFIPLLRDCPDAMLGLLRLTCHRMRLYLHTFELIALQNLPARLVRYMLRLARDYGTEENGTIRIEAGLSQAEMGQQLATSRESINKQLHALEEKGLIAVDSDYITLLDIEGLKRHIAPIN